MWDSSYLFVKIAVAQIPPVTLIALRVVGATGFLLVVMAARAEKLPRDRQTWRMLFVQAVCNSIGSWTVLLIYFRLVRSLWSMGVASQSYLRASVGVMLGIVILGETLTAPIALGLIATVAGVALINLPARHQASPVKLRTR